MSDDSIVYVATAPCGCVHGIDCENGTSTARQVAEWITRGSTVDRQRLGDAKAAIVMTCPHDPKWGRA
jgi:hypothetical protein